MLTKIPAILAAIIALFVLAVLLRTARPGAWRLGSRFVLQYGTPMKVLGVIMLLLGQFLLFAASQSSEDQRTLAWTVSGVLALGAFYFFIEVFFVRIEFDDAFFYPVVPWRRPRQIPWTDVDSVEFSPRNSWYLIRTRHHGVVRASRYLSGISSLLEKLHPLSRA
jgi:hypothetical protein